MNRSEIAPLHNMVTKLNGRETSYIFGTNKFLSLPIESSVETGHVTS